MKKYNIKDMKGGWFIGNFEPSSFVSTQFEVCYKHHNQGDFWDSHYHKLITEVTLVANGKIQINDEIFNKGDIFVIYPGEAVYPVFIEDCDLIIIKTPSIPGDKYTTE